MNVLSMYALIGGYSETGSEWVDEVIEVLSGNINYACDYIEKHFEGVSVSKPEGTYMLFIDCEDWCKANNKSLDDLIQKGWNYGVIWQDGRPFHGEYSIRLNLALPLSRVQEAFRRLDEFVFHQ
jgi:cystathionine beta-lyase